MKNLRRVNLRRFFVCRGGWGLRFERLFDIIYPTAQIGGSLHAAVHRSAPREGSAMRILGIDPGLAIVGFGLIEAETGKMQMAAIRRGHHAGRAFRLAARLVQLERDMEELIAQAPAGGHRGRGAVFLQQHHHRHRRRARARHHPLHRGKERDTAL